MVIEQIKHSLPRSGTLCTLQCLKATKTGGSHENLARVGLRALKRASWGRASQLVGLAFAQSRTPRQGAKSSRTAVVTSGVL